MRLMAVFAQSAHHAEGRACAPVLERGHDSQAPQIAHDGLSKVHQGEREVRRDRTGTLFNAAAVSRGLHSLILQRDADVCSLYIHNP
jgi:hypothetical protein